MALTPRPSEASVSTSFGHDFEEGRVRVTGAWYEVGEGGKFEPNTQLVVEMVGLDKNGDQRGESGLNHYNAGPIHNKNGDVAFYPCEEEGDKFDEDHKPDEGDKGQYLNGPRQPDKYCKMNCFLAALIDRGFKEKEITANAEFLVGTVGVLKSQPFKPPRREEFSIPVFAEVEEYPYESGGEKSRGRGKGRGKKDAEEGASGSGRGRGRGRSAKASEPEPEPEPEAQQANGLDLEEVALDLLDPVIKGHRSNERNTTKSELKKDLVAAAMDSKDSKVQKSQKQIGALIADNAWLERAAGELGFEINGREIVIQ